MPDVKRTVKLVTQQRANDDPRDVPDIPMRSWEISIFLQTPDGDDLPATCFEKATYNLHESFGAKRMKQTFRNAPFTIHEKGWGEFDMSITLTPIGASKNAEHNLPHDLNFQQERYEATHNVTFRNPKGALLEALRESGSVGDEGRAAPLNGTGAGAAPGTVQGKEKKARRPGNRNVDMEKLAEALPQLGEEDLLQVVQMVHDNKSDETYTKNDVDNGEFHVDLYTLPDPLIKMLWDFTSNRVDMTQVA